jgi:putative transposase
LHDLAIREAKGFQLPKCQCAALRPRRPPGQLEHISAGLNRGIPWDVWMMECGGIDSIFGGRSMPKPCSLDLRERVLETVESGASRREAAERFEVSASSAIKWMQRWHETGSIAAKPTGGSISPLEEHADFLLARIAEQPDLTLDEIVAAMRKRRIAGSRSAVWRLFKRHNISFKKKPAGGGARAGGRGPRTAALDARTGHV